MATKKDFESIRESYTQRIAKYYYDFQKDCRELINDYSFDNPMFLRELEHIHEKHCDRLADLKSMFDLTCNCLSFEDAEDTRLHKFMIDVDINENEKLYDALYQDLVNTGDSVYL